MRLYVLVMRYKLVADQVKISIWPGVSTTTNSGCGSRRFVHRVTTCKYVMSTSPKFPSITSSMPYSWRATRASFLPGVYFQTSNTFEMLTVGKDRVALDCAISPYADVILDIPIK